MDDMSRTIVFWSISLSVEHFLESKVNRWRAELRFGDSLNFEMADKTCWLLTGFGGGRGGVRVVTFVVWKRR